MPNLSDDHLWTELSGPCYTTPLLAVVDGLAQGDHVPSGGIVVAKGYSADVGVLKTEPGTLDELVSQGRRRTATWP